MSAPPRVVLAAALFLYAALALTSMRVKSVTFDEPAHLAAGYTYLTLGDFRMNPEHPPLIKVLSAAPLLFLDVTVRTEDATWTRRLQTKFGRQFLYRWNDADRLLFWGRLPVVVLGCVLAALVYSCAVGRWGELGAALSLLLCVLSPDVIAHGQLVTTDVGVALFTFLTVVAFERLTEEATPARLLLAGLSLGAALATKFSAVGLIPILLCLAAVVVVSPEAIRLRFGRSASLTSPLARLAGVTGLLAAMGAIALIVVWTSYGFHSSISPDPAIQLDWNLMPADHPIRRAVDLARPTLLLPETYLYGLLAFADSADSRSAFLLGRHSDRGWWYYFPATFILKTPLPLIVLLALSVARGFGGGGWRRKSFLWLPVLVYALIAMSVALNIGHRHLLPIYPFLFVAAGGAAAPGQAAGRSVGTVILVAVLAAWYSLSAFRIHPHYLAYFNELAGGPERGYRHLVDSNLDWGQDLKGLKAYMDRHGIATIKLSYFGTADPDYYGIACDRLPGFPEPERMVTEVNPGDLLAVSATNLQGLNLEHGRRLMGKLREQQPIDSIGYSILIFRSDFHWSLE